MDQELIKELGLGGEDVQDSIDYIQQCIEIFDQTLKSIGIVPVETTGQAVDNSKITYRAIPAQAYQYADIPEYY